MKKIVLAVVPVLVLAACETGPYLSELPEGVTSIAASGQDLTRVTLLEEDGCYWYEHTNAVETTLLPLRSTRGRHICTQTAETAS